MSGDKSLGASLYRRHTTAALCAQARDGARASFGEALHARHAQFSEGLLRRAGGREQGGAGQRTFVVARRVAGASGGGAEEVGAPVVVEDGERAVTTAPSMCEGSTHALQDAQSTADGRAVPKPLPVEAAVVFRRAPESSGDAAHVSSVSASREAMARDADSASGLMPPGGMVARSTLDTPTIERPLPTPPVAAPAPVPAARTRSPTLLNATRDSGFAASREAMAREADSASGSTPPGGMIARSALETHAIGRTVPKRLAAALVSTVRIGPWIALHTAPDYLKPPSASEHVHVERSSAVHIRHTGASVAARGFVARQTEYGPAAQHATPGAAARGVHTTITDERPTASPALDTASNPTLLENGGALASTSAAAASLEGAARSVGPSGAGDAEKAGPATGRVEPLFATRPIARAVLSASRLMHPGASGPLSPMPPDSRQALTFSSVPSASVSRAAGANETHERATDFGGQRAASDMPAAQASTLSNLTEKPAIVQVSSSAVAPEPRHAMLVLRRTSSEAASAPANVESWNGASVAARESTQDEASPLAAASNAPDVFAGSAESNASSESSVQHGAMETPLPRISTPSAVHVATMPMPVVRAIEHADRAEAPEGIGPAARAALTLKETPLSSAIHRTVDVSREPHPAASARDIAWPSSAAGPFVDIDRATRVASVRETVHPPAAIQRQTPPPLASAAATAGTAIDRDTRAPPTHGEAMPASPLDHKRLPLEHAATSPSPASRAIQTLPMDGASPRQPAATHTAQRAPVTSATVKPQAVVLRKNELPLRLAREPRDLRASPSRVPAAAWSDRGVAPGSAASAPAYIDRTAEQYGVISPIAHIMRDAGTSAPPSMPPPTASPIANTPAAAAASPVASASNDAGELAERAWQLILDKLAIEQERRGYTSWA